VKLSESARRFVPGSRNIGPAGRTAAYEIMHLWGFGWDRINLADGKIVTFIGLHRSPIMLHECDVRMSAASALDHQSTRTAMKSRSPSIRATESNGSPSANSIPAIRELAAARSKIKLAKTEVKHCRTKYREAKKALKAARKAAKLLKRQIKKLKTKTATKSRRATLDQPKKNFQKTTAVAAARPPKEETIALPTPARKAITEPKKLMVLPLRPSPKKTPTPGRKPAAPKEPGLAKTETPAPAGGEPLPTPAGTAAASNPPFPPRMETGGAEPAFSPSLP